ncbi:hypothetical protein, partial [Halomonas urmiana]|uniref:hypothetical protein n=1 Tax=Halomonas urmiana TaxID=490901 RepID=UPI00195EA882
LEAGSWKLEAGSWKLEAGSWKLEGSLLPPCRVSRFSSSFQLKPAKRAFFQLRAKPGYGFRALL